MKGGFGSFFYNTQLAGATISQSTDIKAYESLVQKLKDKGFYTIAQISAFRDREFGNKNVAAGLYVPSGIGLWMDEGGCYWLDPTKSAATNWISSVVLELRNMGFNEVLLSDFCFPNSDQYIFEGDKAAALKTAADTLIASCSADNFVLSFGVTDTTFPLPDGRCRMYVSGVEPGSIKQTVSNITFDDPEIRLVFLAESGDTRYDDYSVLRSLNVAEEVEARKGNS